MEERAVHIDRALQRTVDLLREFASSTDQQELRLAQFLQLADQPGDLRVHFVIALQPNEARAALGKSGERGARIAEHHAAGAEFIEGKTNVATDSAVLL